MTQQYNFAALLEEAQKEGIGGGLLPVGTHTLLAKVVKVSSSQGGKDQIGVMWQALDGAAAGQTTWENQTISPENAKAMAAFFGWCKKFGMDNAFFQRQPQPSLLEIASVIDQLQVVADVGLGKKWGADLDKQDNTFKITQILGRAGVPAAAPAAAVAPVAAPVAPVAPVVAPVAPVAPAAPEVAPVAFVPQPVAAPVAYVAPAPAAPVAVAPVPAEVPQPVAPIDPATGLPARSF